MDAHIPLIKHSTYTVFSILIQPINRKHNYLHCAIFTEWERLQNQIHDLNILFSSGIPICDYHVEAFIVSLKKIDMFFFISVTLNNMALSLKKPAFGAKNTMLKTVYGAFTCVIAYGHNYLLFFLLANCANGPYQHYCFIWEYCNAGNKFILILLKMIWIQYKKIKMQGGVQVRLLKIQAIYLLMKMLKN
ncbi:hypothetical protein ACJX0J_034863 [Zea mays]